VSAVVLPSGAAAWAARGRWDRWLVAACLLAAALAALAWIIRQRTAALSQLSDRLRAATEALANSRATLAEVTAQSDHGLQQRDALAEANATAASLIVQMEAQAEQVRVAMEELRATQEELVSAEKLAVVGQMAGVVAHEVLQPVTAVSVRVELGVDRMAGWQRALDKLEELSQRLLQRYAVEPKADTNGRATDRDLEQLGRLGTALKKNQEVWATDLQFIDRQISRVVRIVDGLRTMSRTRRQMEPVELSKVIGEVTEDMADAFRRRGIHCDVAMVDAPSIEADYTEIYSILTNVVRNAMQAIDAQEPGHPKRLAVRLGTENGFVTIQVEDSGIGVPQDRWEQIFEMGYTSKGREGTGYGLSFCRKLARSYLGDLEVIASTPGKGTTMQIQLPIKLQCEAHIGAGLVEAPSSEL
jgi:two-component system NtrC family sensor kinase